MISETGNRLQAYRSAVVLKGNRKNTKKTTHGSFTLIELLFVIIIVGVLTGISLPNIKKLVNGLELDSSSRHLQTFMNYLRERSIVEGKIIYLNIDNRAKSYWAQIENTKSKLKTHSFPKDIEIESKQKEVLFYPDGSIDKVDIVLINPDNQNITLTTRGIFGGVKLLIQK